MSLYLPELEVLITELVITNEHTIENIDIMAPLGYSDHSLLDISYNPVMSTRTLRSLTLKKVTIVTYKNFRSAY